VRRMTEGQPALPPLLLCREAPTMPRKIGFYSLRKTAKLLCRYLVIFTPIIKKYFPDSPNLHAALDAANVACSVLVDEINLVAEVGV